VTKSFIACTGPVRLAVSSFRTSRQRLSCTARASSTACRSETGTSNARVGSARRAAMSGWVLTVLLLLPFPWSRTGTRRRTEQGRQQHLRAGADVQRRLHQCRPVRRAFVRLRSSRDAYPRRCLALAERVASDRGLKAREGGARNSRRRCRVSTVPIP